MIDFLCGKLIKRMELKIPNLNDERKEIIKYGLELYIGELPKFFLVIIISIIFNIFELTVISFLVISIYRYFSGGIHFKTHIGCTISTVGLYIGNVFFSKLVCLESIININLKIIISIMILIFSLVLIFLYAPADTKNIPIFNEVVRKRKKIYSSIIVILIITISIFIKNDIVSNILIFGVFFQSLTIWNLTYKIFKVELGYKKNK